jgi:hypothetical protein
VSNSEIEKFNLKAELANPYYSKFFIIFMISSVGIIGFAIAARVSKYFELIGPLVAISKGFACGILLT